MLLSTDQHHVKVHRKSYSSINALIGKGFFVPVAKDDTIKGICPTATYRLQDKADIALLNDRTLTINGAPVNGCYAHVPSPAHNALVAGSPTYTAYPGLDQLLTSARTPTTDPDYLTALINEIVREGAQPTRAAPMTTPSQQFRAQWLPDQTLLHLTAGGDYYFTLSFDVRFTRVSRVATPCAVGLDVGLSPIAALQYDGGPTQVFAATPLVRPDMQTLSCKGQALLDDITYASGRQDAEQVVRHLVYSASEVFAEHLRLGDMHRRYVFTSRDRALQDFHQSWLPQYLWAAKIPFFRVASGYTSTECPKCRHTSLNNRCRDHFRCQQCGFGGDAHLVAASNILRRGRRGKRR